MEDMDNVTLFTFQKECKERIKKATLELEGCKALLTVIDTELKVRQNEYEMDRDL
tara:strand:+ start:1972 stop:2136 length:165 start_codon:yes stop_codon:yes gene_type:complete